MEEGHLSSGFRWGSCFLVKTFVHKAFVPGIHDGDSPDTCQGTGLGTWVLKQCLTIRNWRNIFVNFFFFLSQLECFPLSSLLINSFFRRVSSSENCQGFPSSNCCCFFPQHLPWTHSSIPCKALCDCCYAQIILNFLKREGNSCMWFCPPQLNQDALPRTMIHHDFVFWSSAIDFLHYSRT